MVQRTVRQLSGGERRRVALALALGFAELASARTGLRCNLLVLDEVKPFIHRMCLRSIAFSQQACLRQGYAPSTAKL